MNSGFTVFYDVQKVVVSYHKNKSEKVFVYMEQILKNVTLTISLRAVVFIRSAIKGCSDHVLE